MAVKHEAYQMQRLNGAGTYDKLYPYTLLEAVKVSVTDSTTLKQKLDNIDTKFENVVTKDMMGQPDGVATLDSNGYIPASQLNPTASAISKEVPTITDLLALTSDDVVVGEQVFVVDASGDPDIDSGWAIYRKTNTSNFTSLDDDWIRIAGNGSIDVISDWANVTGKPTHITKLGEVDGRLSYEGNKVAYTSDLDDYAKKDDLDNYATKVDLENIDCTGGIDIKVQSMQPAAGSQKEGDFWYETKPLSA